MHQKYVHGCHNSRSISKSCGKNHTHLWSYPHAVYSLATTLSFCQHVVPPPFGSPKQPATNGRMLHVYSQATGALELQRKEEAYQARKKYREKNPSPWGNLAPKLLKKNCNSWVVYFCCLDASVRLNLINSSVCLCIFVG